MKLALEKPSMTPEEKLEIAIWERNMLALLYADGWFYDTSPQNMGKRDFRRILSLRGGKITFHIPDDFDVGNLRQMVNNWDGHSTEIKWKRIGAFRNIVWD